MYEVISHNKDPSVVNRRVIMKDQDTPSIEQMPCDMCATKPHVSF